MSFILSLLAIAISYCSFHFARKSWQESNRPIVVAYIDKESDGEGIAVLNLVIANTGTRPAKNVRIRASKQRIDSIFADGVSEDNREIIYNCFGADSLIVVLKNGESLITSFGYYNCNHKVNKPWLEWFSELPVTISYSDLNDKIFSTNLNLRVGLRDGFGGGVWKSVK